MSDSFLSNKYNRVLSDGGIDGISGDIEVVLDFNIEPVPKTNQKTDISGQFSNMFTIIVSPTSAFLYFILRK